MLSASPARFGSVFRGFLSLLAVTLTTGFWTALVPLANASTPIRVKDLEYIHRTYFFIADHPIEWDHASLRVWRDDGNGLNNAGTIPGKARLDPLRPADPDENPEWSGFYDVLSPRLDYDFTFPYITTGAPSTEIPVIVLARPLAPNEVLGVSYLEKVGAGWVKIGNDNPAEFDSVLGKQAGEVLLRAISPSMETIPTTPGGQFDRSSPWYPSLRYQLRNFYRLGLQNISRGNLNITVRHLDAAFAIDPDAFQGVPFIQILGLDQHGPLVGSPPDGKVDDQYVDWDRGIMLFPDLHPFDPDTSVGGCPPGKAGFLCLDDIGRNTLRACDDPYACIAYPPIYDTKYPDPVSQTRFYLEVSLPEPLAPRVLRQNRPNPFRSGTTIEFVSQDPVLVRLSVHDIHGRLVKLLVRGTLPIGPHAYTWNGTNTAGHPVPSGIYVCRLEGNGFILSRRMVLVR